MQGGLLSEVGFGKKPDSGLSHKTHVTKGTHAGKRQVVVCHGALGVLRGARGLGPDLLGCGALGHGVFRRDEVITVGAKVRKCLSGGVRRRGGSTISFFRPSRAPSGLPTLGDVRRGAEPFAEAHGQSELPRTFTRRDSTRVEELVPLTPRCRERSHRQSAPETSTEREEKAGSAWRVSTRANPAR